MSKGSEVYEDNKRLRAEIDRLHQQRATEYAQQQENANLAADLLCTCLREFLEQRACLHVDQVNGGYRVTFSRPQEPTT